MESFETIGITLHKQKKTPHVQAACRQQTKFPIISMCMTKKGVYLSLIRATNSSHAYIRTFRIHSESSKNTIGVYEVLNKQNIP